MNLFNDDLSVNWTRRPASLLRPTLFLMVLIFIAGAASPVPAQENTAEVCRETKKVQEQLEREKKELLSTWQLLMNEESFRRVLSALNKGISNGRVEISGNDFPLLVNLLGVEQPGATTRDRLAFQRTVRPLVQKALQTISATDRKDLESRIERLSEQIYQRTERMTNLRCSEVLAAEPAVGTMELLGCFKDSNNPFDLDGFLDRSSSNTPESCVAKCRAKGFAYAGVQYGQSCLCGNSYGKQGASSDCNMKCTGDSSKICGGKYCNSVYATGVVPK